jgi:hypothetical protein
MLPEERYPNLERLYRVAAEAQALGLWVALPGYISQINNVASQQTVDVQPTLQGVNYDKDLKGSFANMPELLDVPLVLPGGGGYVATFPFKIGDECLVVFGSRNIDSWWQSSGIQAPMDQRFHDLSDGFAIVGPRSKPKAITNYSLNTMQLRSLDGSVYLELDQPNGRINLVAPNGINFNSGGTITATAPVGTTWTSPIMQFNAETSATFATPIFTGTGVFAFQGIDASGYTGSLIGTLNVTGNITSEADIIAGTISLREHGHDDVENGAGVSGASVVRT